MKPLTMTKIALMTAVICILSPIGIPIPISPVAFTLGTFSLYLCIYVLSPKEALMATGLYLLIGAVGIPVFSGYTAGISRFASPTGGYLVGYLFLVAIGAFFIKRYPNQWGMHLLGMILGTIVTYSIGTFWMAQVTGVGFLAALPMGALVFLPLDFVKMGLAIVVGRGLRRYVWRGMGVK